MLIGELVKEPSGLQEALHNIFDHEYLQRDPEFRNDFLNHSKKWDIFRLSDYLPFSRLKGFYTLAVSALGCSILAVLLTCFSSKLALDSATQKYLVGIEKWRDYDALVQNGLISFGVKFQNASGIYPENQSNPLTLRSSMDYYYDGYKVEYSEAFLMFGSSSSMETQSFGYDGNGTFEFNKEKNMLKEQPLSTCFEIGYTSNESWVEVNGFPECKPDGSGQAVKTWQRKMVEMSRMCQGRSLIDCRNICDNQKGILTQSGTSSFVCVTYYVLAAVCLVFDFSSEAPEFIQGCFSNQAMTYYIQANPGEVYGLNQTMWMIRDINDPYVLAYELSKIPNDPLGVFSSSVWSFVVAALALSASLLLVILTFGYFLILAINEKASIKKKVFQAHGLLIYDPFASHQSTRNTSNCFKKTPETSSDFIQASKTLKKTKNKAKDRFAFSLFS